MSLRMSTKLLAALRWYENGKMNNGRGRLSGTTAILARAGMLSIKATGRFDWVACISEKGLETLEHYKTSTISVEKSK